MRGTTRPWLHWLLVPLLYAAIYTAVFSDAGLSGKLLAPADGQFFHVPNYYSPANLWNDALFSGYPVGADPQSMLWYPPFRLFRALGISWNIAVVSAYVLASVFAYTYIHEITRHKTAAFLGGSVYGMSGFFFAHLGHTNMIHAAAWLPLFLLCLERLRGKLSLAWLACTALAVGHCLLAGHPQIFIFALCLGGCYALTLGWRAPVGRGRFWLASSAGVALGIGLGAVLLLPAMELSQYSPRAEIDYDTFVAFSLPVRELPRLLFPFIYGGLWLGESSIPCFGRSGFCEVTGYVGLLTLMLAVCGVAANHRRPHVRFWLGVSIVTLLLGFGDEFAGSKLLYYLPVYNKFRCPARHFFEAALAAGVLSSFGVIALSQMRPILRLRASRFAILGVGGVMLGMLILFVIQLRLGEYTITDSALVPWCNIAIGIPWIVFALGAAALLAFARRPGLVGQLLLTAVVLLDLGTFGYLNEWRCRSPRKACTSVPKLLDEFKPDLAANRQRLLPLIAYPTLVPEMAAPNSSLAWGVPSALGYNPLVPIRYCDLLGCCAHGFVSYASTRSENLSLDLLAVRYVLFSERGDQTLPDGTSPETNLADSVRWRHVASHNGVAVYENLRAQPRAWLVPNVRRAKPTEILSSIHKSALPDGSPFDVQSVALVEDEVALDSQTEPLEGRVKIDRFSASERVLNVACNRPGFLVLSESYYPGWRVAVNGTPARLVPTNYTQMGVVIPAGKSTVRFHYRPSTYLLGGSISLGCLALVCGLLSGHARRVFAGRKKTAWNKLAGPQIPPAKAA